MMDRSYDAIILGAGHNGLILQAYLGKAGLRTLALERKAVPGGGLSTAEVASAVAPRRNARRFIAAPICDLQRTACTRLPAAC